jgi:hypothetical protein
MLSSEVEPSGVYTALSKNFIIFMKLFKTLSSALGPFESMMPCQTMDMKVII